VSVASIRSEKNTQCPLHPANKALDPDHRVLDSPVGPVLGMGAVPGPGPIRLWTFEKEVLQRLRLLELNEFCAPQVI
jgi:hypothetical protein